MKNFDFCSRSTSAVLILQAAEHLWNHTFLRLRDFSRHFVK